MDGARNDEVTRHVRKTAQAIAELHAAHRAGSTPAERRLERLVSHLSTPWFIGLVTIAVTAWIGSSALSAFDPMPYPLLQGVLTLLAVYISLAILTAQRRAGVLADLRAQVTLEHCILTEHKAAKMIELLEELRRDHPAIANRTDGQADALAQPTDPKLVADAIVASHEEIKEGASPAEA
jgi:uncharacterized membrane protein